MIAKSFSSLALILLLFISVCSAKRTVGYYDSPYIHSTSRAGKPRVRPTKRPGTPAPNRPTSPRPTKRPATSTPIRTTSPTAPNLDRPISPTAPNPDRPISPIAPNPDRPISPIAPNPDRPISPTEPNPDRPTSPTAGNPTSPNAGGPSSRPSTAPSSRPEPSQGRLPDFDYTVKNKAIAVWGANADLSKGTKVRRGLGNRIRGSRMMVKELKAAGRDIKERTRCHMIAKTLGGKGEPYNLFACFEYFNGKAMGHFEAIMSDKIPKLQGQDKCRMEVTALFTPDKQYPTSVNMDAKCKGSQLFNVTILNKLQENEVRIDHLCKPTGALGPPRFRGTATLVRGASAC